MLTIRRSMQVTAYVVAGVLVAASLFAAFWGTVIFLPAWLSIRETPDSPKVRLNLGGRAKATFEEMLPQEKAAYEDSWHPVDFLGADASGEADAPRVYAFYRADDQLLIVTVARAGHRETLPRPHKIANDPGEGLIGRFGRVFLKYNIRDD